MQTIRVCIPRRTNRLEFTKAAYALSERFDTPVLLRLSTRISHSRSLVECGERENIPNREYRRDIAKNVMMPAMAKKAHLRVEERTRALTEWADTEAFDCGINKTEYFDTSIGIIAAGSTYDYAREALGEGASYLKLGIVNPLPVEAIKRFAAKVKKLYVIEELDDIIETHCIKLGLDVTGRALFPPVGEYNRLSPRKYSARKSRTRNWIVISRRARRCFARAARTEGCTMRLKAWIFMSAAI